MAKQSVGVRERSPGNYEINFRPYRGAKSVFRNIEAPSLREASMIRAKLMLEARQKTQEQPAQPQQTDFQAIWSVLESDIKIEGPTSLVGLRNVYNRMFFDFRNLKHPEIVSPAQLDSIFFLDYRNYVINEVSHPEDKPYKGWREELKRLKTIINKMRTRKFVSNDLIMDLKRIKLPEANEKEYPEISQTQMRTLMDFIRKDRPDLYGPIKFMLRTGRRIEEVTLIERKDVIWNGFNPVEMNIRAETTKMKTKATLKYLDEDLRQHVRLYYSISKEHQAPYLFLNAQFNKCQQEAVRRYLERVSKEVIGSRITSHYFRHRFCTETCKAKLPMIDIQAICGIKDVATILRKYCHSSQDGMASVLEKTRL